MTTCRNAPVLTVLIDKPGLHNTFLPMTDRRHPWIHQQTFYTLPVDLWKAVIKELGSSRFKADDIALELRLSEICEDLTAQAGFRDDEPISFYRLRTKPIDAPKPDCDEWQRKSDAEWKGCLQELNTRWDYFVDLTRGYLGWLLTNSMFLDEHDRLWELAASELVGAAVPRRIEARRSGNELPDGWQVLPNNAGSVAAKFREFCSRWRMSQLAGPYLPQPLEPRIPNLLASQQAGLQFQIPDIIAIDGSGLVRKMITDSQRRGDLEHLSEWLQIVDPENQGRKTIYRFARIFELQHYGRALAQRHPDALARNKERLHHAFASYFRTSIDTIRGDLRFMKKRLSRGHYQAPAWLDAV